MKSHNIKKRLTISVFFSLLVCLAAPMGTKAAEKVYLQYFEMINGGKDVQYSTARLFKTYLEETGRWDVVLPPRPDTLIPFSQQDSVRSLSTAARCSKFIIGEMNQIGNTTIISIRLYGAETGSLLWIDRLKASNHDDFDPILQKFARTMGTEFRAAADDDIYSVTTHESKPLKQINTRSAFGVAIGSAGIPAGLFSDEPFASGLGVLGFYDARDYLFGLDAHYYGQGSSELSFISISANKAFSSRNVTPFAGIGLGIMNVEGGHRPQQTFFSNAYDGSGLMVNAGGGYLFSRTSNVQLHANAKYFVGLFKMDDPDRTIPHGLLFNMAISFGL